MVIESAKAYKDYFDLEEIIKNIKEYLKDFDEKEFIKAFEFAERYHKDQTRKNGTPYITHPIETVQNLIKLHVDEDTLIAALLHDVPEDTEASMNEVKKEFGENIAFLVDGITKLSKVYYRNDMEERQVESLKKLLIHTAKDPRVVLIKLADRLHNMQTLEYVPDSEKRTRIAKETLEIYVPIANLLGIQGIKSELEDLCFKHLYPEDYEKLRAKIFEGAERHKNTLNEMIYLINKNLAENHINAKVYGREKNLYSIYKKIISENKTVDDIHDRIAFRIITKKVSDCYAALGVVHNLFTPKPGHFKDYIAVPKINGYQSIHTTVFGANGVLTEIQIRTEKMHTDAEYGIAAHYFYDASKTKGGQQLVDDQRSLWIGKILELQKSQKDSNEFISELKIDIFQDRIFTFTPEGETIDLPKNATAIDFAYAIHTELGNHAGSAEINYELKPITTILKTGDYVKIITSKDVTPKLSWLSFVKTNVARNKIKLYLRKESTKKKIAAGMEMLQKELDRSGFGLIEDMNFKKINNILFEKTNQNFNNRKELFEAIGEGDIQAIDIIKYLKLLKKSGDTSNAKVVLKVVAENRPSLMKEIIDILVSYNADFLYARGHVSFFSKKAVMLFYINFSSLNDFSEVCQHIEQVKGVERVGRLFKLTSFSFYTVAFGTLAFWLFHPLFISRLSMLNLPRGYEILSSVLLYLGLFMLLFTVVYLKKIIRKSFPMVRDMKWLWVVTFITATVAVSALLIELYIFEIYFNWMIIFGGILFMYAYLAAQFLDYKNSNKDNKD